MIPLKPQKAPLQLGKYSWWDSVLRQWHVAIQYSKVTQGQISYCSSHRCTNHYSLFPLVNLPSSGIPFSLSLTDSRKAINFLTFIMCTFTLEHMC